jgi:hypothetical protein
MMSKRCDQCGREFVPPADAPHKRFCQTGCRQTWHTLRRQAAMQLLRATTGDKAAQKSATELGL